jgi:hypothetical protein
MKDELIKMLESIDEKISKLWDKRYDKERNKLFDLRGQVCEMIKKSQRK